MAFALSEHVRALEEELSALRALTIGKPVFIHRGNPARGPETGPGYGRLVRAKLLAAPCFTHEAECELLEDDPAAVGGACKAGDIGYWCLSSITFTDPTSDAPT